jgi:hypothetical protein
MSVQDRVNAYANGELTQGDAIDLFKKCLFPETLQKIRPADCKWVVRTALNMKRNGLFD